MLLIPTLSVICSCRQSIRKGLANFNKIEPEWAAPSLWRSEFRNVLALYLRQKIVTLAEALMLQDEAEALMTDQEFTVTSMQVLTLTDSSTCSAYDCEFVALAKQLSVKLVTQDKKILREFPDVAVSLDDFLVSV